MENVNIFRGKIVHITANASGRAEPQAEILLLIILGYIVIVFFLIFIHRKIIKRHKRIYENLILLYDTVRYQIAKTQYGNPTIQNMKGIKVVMESDHERYLPNAKAIREEIFGIEQRLGQQIVTEEQWKNISKQTKKKSRVKGFMQLIGWFITLITAGIYKLFW